MAVFLSCANSSSGKRNQQIMHKNEQGNQDKQGKPVLPVELEIEDDFILTISVEEATIRQGENFKVNVELKNNSEEDQKMSS